MSDEYAYNQTELETRGTMCGLFGKTSPVQSIPVLSVSKKPSNRIRKECDFYTIVTLARFTQAEEITLLTLDPVGCVGLCNHSSFAQSQN